MFLKSAFFLYVTIILISFDLEKNRLPITGQLLATFLFIDSRYSEKSASGHPLRLQVHNTITYNIYKICYNMLISGSVTDSFQTSASNLADHTNAIEVIVV